MSLPVLAHHAAEGIVDEEIYAMIDALVADTPHAEMTLEDLGGGMSATTVTTSTVGSLQNMIGSGVLIYSSMLSGDVDVEILFSDDGSASLTIYQALSPRD